MKTPQADAAVIGGGAAGLMAAAMLAERGAAVLLIEPNRVLGRKLRITGKGRCNLTNNCDTRGFLENVPRNARFLHSAVSRFGPQETMAFFERLGVPLKTERGNRVFPAGDSAHALAGALERYGRELGVRLLNKRVTAINAAGGVLSGLEAEDTRIECGAAILCTGGASYPGTGSTGQGYGLAERLGHSIIAPRASLVPLVSDDAYCAEMQGFSLKNVTARVYDENNKRVFEELGELLFTHFGVSGPLVLSASAHIRDFCAHRYRLSIDLKPGLDARRLDERIRRDFKKYANRDFANALHGLAGRAMIPVLVRLSGIPGETKVHSVTREQRRALVSLFKGFPVSISGPRPIAEAIITSGGVDTREIDPKTMASKIVSGLYFAGEIIDVDAYTGGFNLQIAWSTAYAAAQGAACR
ncbi:MAG: NAD(P)/FAD-dependent oxidoreductase [Oscillospiraceae bacterium]|jgi:predicted Rossmann fold flavoprotein|nr:NAD(P)/FAD-dependent oxidoreductase [Oscillospiraceae bacterium]